MALNSNLSFEKRRQRRWCNISLNVIPPHTTDDILIVYMVACMSYNFFKSILLFNFYTLCSFQSSSNPWEHFLLQIAFLRIFSSHLPEHNCLLFKINKTTLALFKIELCLQDGTYLQKLIQPISDAGQKRTVQDLLGDFTTPVRKAGNFLLLLTYLYCDFYEPQMHFFLLCVSFNIQFSLYLYEYLSKIIVYCIEEGRQRICDASL